MVRTWIFAAALALSAGSLATQVSAAEAIEGNWKTLVGDTARIASCDKGFCITLANGKFAGKQIGHMQGAGGLYNGQITDPKDDKTYEGSAAVTGNALKLQGCVLKIFCKTQIWVRQP
jgi:uncharacterized protein (DUF2147 family)